MKPTADARISRRDSRRDSAVGPRAFVATFCACVCVSVCAGLFLASPLRAAQWPDEYRANQFICHADFPLAEHRDLLNSMPLLEQELSRLLGIRLSREPVHVFLFERKSTYEAYLAQYFPDAPSRKALFIKQRGQCMVFAHRGDDLGFETDLRHECTHALLNTALPIVPLWLDEGLAEYFEMPQEQREQNNQHLTYVTWAARFGQVPRLEDLEQIRDLEQMNRGRYRHAWAWVHFLLHGPAEARDELQRYLADIQALTPPGRLSERLRRRLPDIEQQFAAHFKNW